MALPYHIMVLATEGTNITLTKAHTIWNRSGAFSFVLGISAIGVIMRTRLKQSGR